MWSAIVETDFWDEFRLIRPDGVTGGKALLSFLTITNSVCSNHNSANDDVAAWINRFNENSDLDFCEIIAKLNNAYYSGNWDYEDDEYDIFLLRSPGFEITETDFKRTIKEVREMWTNVDEIIKDIQALIHEFKIGYLEQTDWYAEDDTIGDFEGLLHTLTLAKERKAQNVRIRIE